jgi:hypothetical protein
MSNDEERKEALMRFAKTVGDAAGAIALGFVAMGAAMQECTKTLDELFTATQERPDDPDRT